MRALCKSARQERGKRDTWNEHEGEGKRTRERDRETVSFLMLDCEFIRVEGHS